MRTILSALVATPFVMLSLAACSAAPESTGTTNEAFSVAPVRAPSPINWNPAPPPWPVPDATYCPTMDPRCTVTELTYADGNPEIRGATELQSLGCTPPLRMMTGTPNGLIEITYALCYDTPAVEASADVLAAPLCTACMPEPPPGQVYVSAGFAAVGPNCPSGCLSNPSGPPRGTSSSGGGTVLHE